MFIKLSIATFHLLYDRSNLCSVSYTHLDVYKRQVRFKISKGKDFEISYPINITPWPKSYTRHVEQLIQQEQEIAKNAKNFYQNYGGIKRNKTNGQLEYPPLPPVVYVAEKNTLKQLGIEYNMETKPPTRKYVIE